MNISPINFVSLSKNVNFKNNVSRYKYNQQCDSVTFTSKRNVTKQELSQNAQEGITIGKKILKLAKVNLLNYETLTTVLNENSPVPIGVEDINNMPNMAKVSYARTVAHMLPGYTPDLKLAIANIYLCPLPATSKEISDFAANVAHEYTHVLQRAQDDNYYGIVKYTKNPNEVALIARTSQIILNEIIRTCQQKLFTNEKELKTVVNSIITNKFDIDKSLGKIDYNKIIEQASIKLASQLNKNQEDMKDAVKGWIIQETQNEKEAYTVTLDVLESSKYDLNTKASRILSREIYSYINKSLTNDD